MGEPEAVHLKCKNDIGAEFGAFDLVMISQDAVNFETL